MSSETSTRPTILIVRTYIPTIPGILCSRIALYCRQEVAQPALRLPLLLRRMAYAPASLTGAPSSTGNSAAMAFTYAQVPCDIYCLFTAAHNHVVSQARTLEVMNYLGTLPDVLAQGRALFPVRIYKPGEPDNFKTIYMVEPQEPTPSIPWVCPAYY